MYTFLVILLIINALVLIVAILLQSGKGGGLAASFGGASSATDAFIGSRQAGTILTKASWWGGGIFLGLAFVLQLMSTNAGRTAPKSVLDKSFAAPPPAAAPEKKTAAPNLPIQPVGDTSKKADSGAKAPAKK